MVFIHEGAPAECPTPHDPDSSVWYSFIWDQWLETNTDIMTSEWIIPADLTMDGSQTDVVLVVNDRGRVVTFQHANRVKLSGGVLGSTYTVTNRVKTSIDGVTEYESMDKSMIISCLDQ